MPPPVVCVCDVGGLGEFSRQVRDHADARRSVANRRRSLGKSVQHRLHELRVKSVRHRQALCRDPLRFEILERGRDGVGRTRDDDVFRPVDRRDRDGIRVRHKDGSNALFLGENRRHRAARAQALHEATALGDEPNGVLHSEDTRDASRDVFAKAMTQHGFRNDAPGHPHSGERVLEGKKRRLGMRGFIQQRGIDGLVVEQR